MISFQKFYVFVIPLAILAITYGCRKEQAQPNLPVAPLEIRDSIIGTYHGISIYYLAEYGNLTPVDTTFNLTATVSKIGTKDTIYMQCGNPGWMGSLVPDTSQKNVAYTYHYVDTNYYPGRLLQYLTSTFKITDDTITFQADIEYPTLDYRINGHVRWIGTRE